MVEWIAELRWLAAHQISRARDWARKLKGFTESRQTIGGKSTIVYSLDCCERLFPVSVCCIHNVMSNANRCSSSIGHSCVLQIIHREFRVFICAIWRLGDLYMEDRLTVPGFARHNAKMSAFQSLSSAQMRLINRCPLVRVRYVSITLFHVLFSSYLCVHCFCNPEFVVS